MAHVHYGRLLREVSAILERTLFMIKGSTDVDVEGLASALRTIASTCIWRRPLSTMLRGLGLAAGAENENRLA
jgi:hypothetical protein